MAARAGIGLEAPMKYFNEYLYYDLVQRYNATHEVPIKKRQALQVRDLVTEQLKKQNKPIGQSNRAVFMAAVDGAFEASVGEKPFSDEREMLTWYNERTKNFAALTGLKTAGGVTAGEGETYLPLSPYDPQFSMRETFLNAGNRMVYAKGSDIMRRVNGGKLGKDNAGAVFNETMILYTDTETADITNVQRDLGPALTAGDMSGFSMLSTLVSERNAREVRAWVNQDGNPNPVYSPAPEIRKAYRVLRQLKDEGVQFEFKRDERPGQLKARVLMTGMPSVDVRVLDPVNPQYGGCSRIYMDGVQGYYSTDKQEKRVNPVTGRTETVSMGYTPTVQERVDLIKFGLGQSVKRGDDKAVGTPGTYGDGRTYMNESYHSGKSFSAMVRPLPDDATGKVFIRMVSTKGPEAIRFRNSDDAENYLSNAIDSARANFATQVNVEGLIQEAKDHAGETDYLPAAHSDPEIDAIRSQYWDVLTGKDAELLQAGQMAETFDEAMDTLEESGLTGTALEALVRKDAVYEGTPEDKVRAHFMDLTNVHIGTLLPDDEGKRFNPVTVAKYMTSSYGQYRNSSDIVNALRTSGISADDLRGSEYYNKAVKDKLIQFDLSTAREMRSLDSPFMKTMFSTIRDSLLENGCQVSEKDILIDGNGVVEYKATKLVSKAATVKGRKEIVGHIGQILEPDEKGLIQTKFAGSDNYLFAPGMTADVVPNQRGENKPYEQRVRIKTYQQSMADGIRYAIRDDIMSEWQEVGSTTSLNGIVRRNQGVRFDKDDLYSKPEHLRDAIIDAEVKRVVFSNEITRNAGRYELYKYSHDMNRDANDDVHMDAIGLLDGENYTLLRPEQSAGIFDPRATGTGPAQGSRYLVNGAEILADGSIKPATDRFGKPDGEAVNGLSDYINKHMGEFDAIDRYDMTVTALRHCHGVGSANVSQMAFGGWVTGDALVVSKEWAEANGIKDIGDKLSDFHGNKGVISLIVDRNMDLAEANAQGIQEAVEWFKANPELDIVMSPYSAVSRFNGGLYREALSHEAKDLVAPDGTVHKGSLCQLDMIIMEQTADKKSTDYEDEEEVNASSRNFGGQTGWALGANGALQTMQDAFYGNNRSLVNFREMLIATGMDMDETGTLHIGYRPQEGESRPVFEMQPLIMKTKRDKETGETVPDVDKDTGRQRVDYQAMKASFGTLIEQSGGMLEMPFPVRFPKGKAVDSDGMAVDMGETPEIPVSERSAESVAAYGGKTYALPIMSAYMRSGQEFEDGTSRTHDYTGQYIRMYECSLRYRDMAENGAPKEELEKVQAQAQQEYNKITDDLIASKFTGKRNVARTTLLGAKQKAVTAVATPDPRLKIGEIAINPAMGEAFGLKEGDRAFVYRDPILSNTGIGSRVVKYDSGKRGASIHPCTCEQLKEDFDGDTNGIKRLDSRGAAREAEEKYSEYNRLLVTWEPADEHGNYELNIDAGEEHAAGRAKDRSLEDWRERLKVRANEIERNALDGSVSQKAIASERRAIMEDMDGYIHAALDASYGMHPICYSDAKSCLQSIEQYVADGVKGSPKKLDTFAKYLGVTYERDAVSGEIKYDTFEDKNRNLTSLKERLDPLDARNMQQAYTGPAGGQTIQSMVFAAAAEDADFTNGLSGRKVTAAEIMESFTTTTMNVTQGVLQVKHSADQAHRMEDVMQNYLVSAMSGYKLERSRGEDGEPVWNRVKDDEGRPMQATPQEFYDNVIDVYSNGLGVAVVPDKVKVMADYLTDKETGLIMTMQQRREKSPALQRIAYDGSGDNGFATVQKMAYENRNLYADSPNLNAAMRPSSILNNQQAAEVIERGEEPEHSVKAIVDVRVREAAGHRRGSELVQTAKARSERSLSDVHIPEAASVSAEDQQGLGN